MVTRIKLLPLIVVLIETCLLLIQNGANGGLHALEQRRMVVDDMGHAIVLATPARRIISLAPDLTELLFASGAGPFLVGVSDFSDNPPEARTIPRIGGAGRLDMERIVTLTPDLVVVWDGGNSARQLAALARRGVPTYHAKMRQLAEIETTLTRFGLLAGTEPIARQQAEIFHHDLAQLRQRFSHLKQIGVFYQIWGHPTMTVSNKHLIHDLLIACGGVPLLADTDALTSIVNQESLLAANPEIILASGLGEERPPWLEEWRQWPWLAAVRHNLLFNIPPDLIQRGSPRLLQGMERVCLTLQQGGDGHKEPTSVP